MSKLYLVISLLIITTNLFAEKINDKELMESAKNTFGIIKPTDLIDKSDNIELIKLGKKLYFESALSKNGKISCNSCHNLETYGVDNQKTSPGHDGTRGDRNSPTTLNAGYHFKQFWDGRAQDLEEQALGPLLNPIEHGLASKEEAIEKLSSDEYTQMFKAAKIEKNFNNIGKAIAAFEKTLITPTRFDEYMAGNSRALKTSEKRGLQTFMRVGCTACHAGPVLGGESFQKLGLIKPYETEDEGLYKVTKKKRDKYKFKVPSLRNIEKTAPYLHDGSIESLEEMIKIMGTYQLGKDLSDKEVKDIVAFLKSLTAKEIKY